MRLTRDRSAVPPVAQGFPNDPVWSLGAGRGSAGRWASLETAVRLSHGEIWGWTTPNRQRGSFL
jgi:hypothetical protein